MRRDIAQITGTFLGVEDHGILTCTLTVDYGGGRVQTIGGYSLDTPSKDSSDRVGTDYGMEFVARVMRTCGVRCWEHLVGRTIYVLQDLEPDAPTWGPSNVVGIEKLPTEPGGKFLFGDLAGEFI